MIPNKCIPCDPPKVWIRNFLLSAGEQQTLRLPTPLTHLLRPFWVVVLMVELCERDPEEGFLIVLCLHISVGI